MGGLFGVVSTGNCANDLFFGVDYHSHLGTTIGGVAVLADRISEPICHEITNSQFKTEFKDDLDLLEGNIGIGVISSRENERQPIIFKSKLGTFALCTDASIKNATDLILELVNHGVTFNESSGLNQTELVGEIICKGNSITQGIANAFEKINGTLSLLLLSENARCIYAAGGVFPLAVGRKTTKDGDNWAIASETTAFMNLHYTVYDYPQYKNIFTLNHLGIRTRMKSQDKIVFCPFLHVYFDFPTSSYYQINGEIVRERCGGFLAENDEVRPNMIMGVADSGLPHAHGYAKQKIELAIKKSQESIQHFEQGDIDLGELRASLMKNLESIAPLRRPVIKYTAGWGRSYIPPQQSTRDLIAYYKQVSNPDIISHKSIILVDDSIRRGTQLRKFIKDKILLFKPKAIHARIASPPQLFPCYFDETTKANDLIARTAIKKIEKTDPEDISEYLDQNSVKYRRMVDLINESIGASSLRYIALSDMIKAIIEAPRNMLLREENLCTYCWTGKKPV